jgi:hypothetical protein
MGTFAETAIVDKRSSMANQGEQTSVEIYVCGEKTEVCLFRFLFAANKQKLPFFVYTY